LKQASWKEPDVFYALGLLENTGIWAVPGFGLGWTDDRNISFQVSFVNVVSKSGPIDNRKQSQSALVVNNVTFVERSICLEMGLTSVLFNFVE